MKFINSLFLISVCVCLLSGCGTDRSQTVVIGCKNFTEQAVLGEIIAQTIEQHTELTVVRKWNLGGTMICHQALTSGEIDIYPEYTGTAYITILNQTELTDAKTIFDRVNDHYQTKFRCEWLEPFGANNTYTLTVRKSDAKAWNITSISELNSVSESLIAGFTAEFMERQDGYPKLQQRYGLRFNQVVDLEPGLMYDAIANQSVDVICGFSTDGRIQAFDLVELDDDLNFFPPYFAAPVVRQEIFLQHPQLKPLLNKLGGVLTNQTMQQLNLRVDQDQASAKKVAEDFLATL